VTVKQEDVQPGDLFVVEPGEHLFDWIERGEDLIDRKKLRQHPELTAKWGHVGIASRRLSNGQLMIVEAEPGGAVERPWHWCNRPHLWSTGILPGCPAAGDAALRYAGYEKTAGGWVLPINAHGVGYSFLDYQAIFLHANHIPFPGLKTYIESTRHMICSQLGDQARLDGGSHLFDDGRWPGYVTPLDIGLLLEGVQ
jgi:hypothetical protein